MFKDLTHKLATLSLTAVMSATCVLSAVGPAAAHDGAMKAEGKSGAAVATAARFVA